MRRLSQRRVFTLLMTVFATTFVIAITGQVLGNQGDLLEDILKIAGMVSFSTAVVSYVAWTLTHLKHDGVRSGVLAGFLSTVAIIPLPIFAWTLKTEFFAGYQSGSDGLFAAFVSAMPTAINAGLYTFIDITKASLIAIIASMILGGVISYYVAPKGAAA